ncbi:hypothetical protein [Streptomyces sp. S186]|uniref:hypothetical protein n=1 Tax=Streptomyces sp. S186 TaxID=3434395 RepID=UPI003F6685D3
MKSNTEPYKEIVTQGLGSPYGLAIDGADNVAYVCSRGSLVKVDLKSGSSKAVADGLGDPHTVVLDGHGNAYTPDVDSGGRLHKVDLGSGSKVAIGPTDRAESMGVAMNSQKSTLYLLASESGPLYKLTPEGTVIKSYSVPSGTYHSVAIDKDEKYAYVVRDYQTILQVDLAGGATSDLATGFSHLYDLALVEGDALFAPDAATGILWRVDLKTKSKEQVVSELGDTHGTASWGKDAFVTNSNEGKLFRVKNAFSPVKPPVVTEPTDGARVYPQQHLKGTVTDADKVVAREGGKEIGSVVPTGKEWTLNPDRDWSLGKHEVEVFARKGKDESISVVVHFDVVPAPVLPPVITDPKEKETVGLRQQIKGTAASADQVTLTDFGKGLGPARLIGRDWAYTPVQEWSMGAHEIHAVAHKGGQESPDAVVHFTVTDPNLTVSQKLMSHWKKAWDKPQYIYSFELAINAKKDRTVKWTLSFGVEKDVTVDPDWAKSFWAQIVKDGSDGTVEIQNSDPTHTIDPNKPLPIDIQLLCPGEGPSYGTVYNPVAHRNE